MKLGIIREGKTPPDKRVPFSPSQCVEILKKFDKEENPFNKLLSLNIK